MNHKEHTEEDYQALQKINWENVNYLEQENAKLQKRVDELLNESFEDDMAKLKLIAERDSLKKRLESLQEENYSLESQLKEIRYLSEDEVEKQFLRFSYYFPERGCNGVYEIEGQGLWNFISELCKLAIPKIDREKVIAAIDCWLYDLGETYIDFDLVEPTDINKLANEIIKEI